jgi:hypothetical protein
LQIQAKDPFRTSKNNLINRLDNLNAYASEHNNQIVQFASSDYQYKRGMAIHVAGFPVRPYGSTSEIPRWTSYQTVYSNSDFSYDTSSNSNN